MTQPLHIPPEQEELFRFTFKSPIDDHIRRLTPVEYGRFIYYLFQRDGLYHPVLVDGPGDGGVDIELYARNGVNPELCGVVQCKRFLLEKVTPNDLAPVIVAANMAKITRKYCFTTSGYTPPARASARNNDVKLFDSADVRFWIQDITRRESLRTQSPNLPDLDSMPIPIICVTNNKGGVGKTTLTGNLAAAFATEQHNVLVIDADPQGHLTSWLTDQRHNAPALSLHAVLTQDVPIYPLMQRTTEKGVWILPSTQELHELPGGHNAWTFERKLAHALAALPLSDPPIRYVLIDTPPGLGSITRSAMLAAKSLLIPLQLEVFSLEGLDALLGFIVQTETIHQKKPLQILGGVATRVDMRFRWGFRFRDRFDLQNRPRLQQSGLTDEQFWCGLLRERGEYKKSQAEHQSVLQYARRSDAADDIWQLAQEVTHRVPILTHLDTRIT
ncbi:MAG: AAA family ATPase [Ktedonobacterales bacterium]